MKNASPNNFLLQRLHKILPVYHYKVKSYVDMAVAVVSAAVFSAKMNTLNACD